MTKEEFSKIYDDAFSKAREETKHLIVKELPRILHQIYYLAERDGDTADHFSKLEFSDVVLVIRALEQCITPDELEGIKSEPFNDDHERLLNEAHEYNAHIMNCLDDINLDIDE